MTPEVVLIVGFIVLVFAFLVLVAVINGKRMRAKEEEMKQAASSRGWTFEKVHEHGYRLYRFTGTTEGVKWLAESGRKLAGGQKRSRRRHVTRWHGQYSPGIHAPILGIGVPKGKEKMGDGVLQGDGFLAQLAVKAAGFALDTSIDMHFGKQIGDEVDARTLKHIASAPVPGFILMAGNVDEASRVLSEGLERALEDATQDRGGILSDDDRPYILFRPTGISLARNEEFGEFKELERFVHAGVALTRAFRFGRRA